ncbi:MAG TPA: flagellar biosynthetic protein FliO, partial [Polyangiaceae bacterium]|nr:flagellar biosynthetic protein FliO [Polyangiaceae bacterium]
AKGTSDSVSVLRFTLFGVVLFGLSMYALYRHQRGRMGRGTAAQRSALTLEGAVRVGPRAQVVVVNVAGRKLLLGVTESEVSRLAWLDDGMEPEAESEPERAEAPAPRAFTAVEPRHQPAFETRRLAAPATAPTPDQTAPRSTAAASAAANGAGKNAAPKRFRDALLGALGHKTTDAPEPAAVAIAEATQDVVSRSRTAPIAAPPGAPEMVDVEGQARGLVMRLQKRA